VRSSDAPSRTRFQVAVALAVLAASIAAIGTLRVRLVERFERLKVRSDVYALPSPDQLIVASLGYRSGLADILYANTLVAYGIHFQENRRFEYVGNYLDAITTLDPSIRVAFMYADTLLVMQPVPPRFEDYVKARQMLERGMRAFPQDAELWLNAGQFMAYLAAPNLGDKKLKEQWRLEGARILAKACEFVSSNENVPYHCITAATLLSKAGEREATIQFLERVLTVSDDDEIKRIALRYLERIYGEEQRERAEFRQKRFREAWGADLPFVGRNLLLLIGPAFDPARCAGSGLTSNQACATTWRAWAEQLEGSRAE